MELGAAGARCVITNGQGESNCWSTFSIQRHSIVECTVEDRQHRSNIL